MSIPFIDLKSQQARIRDKIDRPCCCAGPWRLSWGQKSQHWRKGLQNGLEPNTIFPVPRERMRYYLRCRG